MSIFFEILVRIASYGPQIDQSHGENRLSHIITGFISILTLRKKETLGSCSICVLVHPGRSPGILLCIRGPRIYMYKRFSLPTH